MVKIHHHGAVTGVTGSCHELFFAPDRSVLIDCGLFQGAEAADFEDGNFAIDFPIDHVEALFLTHCHIDHVGRIPWLLAAGFDAPIVATEATAKLLPMVLEDALKVGVTRNQTLIKKVLARVEHLLMPVPYDEWCLPLAEPLMKARFRVAGHILGSAYIEFETQKKRVVFSGDLGAPYTPLLPSPKPPYKADILVIESTYGDRVHEGRRARRMALKAMIERALKDHGSILIPAFSIGRTQELLYELEHIIHHSQGTLWDDLDVVVDSPLAAKFTSQYRALKHLWDKEARSRTFGGRHPLAFDNMITVDSHSGHKKIVHYLKTSGRPAIIIAASGMCAGGRIVNYLKALIEDRRTDILFVGYQAEGTPGRDIQRYGPRGGYVVLDGKRFDIKAQIHTLGGYSAHADQKDLVRFVRRIYKKPEEIRIVHGDEGAKKMLSQALRNVAPSANVIIAE